MAYLIRTKNIPEGVRIEEGIVIQLDHRKLFRINGKENPYKWLPDKPLYFNNGVMWVETEEDINKALDMLRSYYRKEFFRYQKLCKSAENKLHILLEESTQRRVNHSS